MNVSHDAAVDFPSALAQAWRDTWLRIVVATFVLLSVPFLVPADWFSGLRDLRGWLTLSSPAIFLILLLPSYLLSRRSARDAQERRFWTDLLLAFAVWLFIRLGVTSVWDRETHPPLRELLLLLLYSLAYVLQLVAAERQPHRANAWRPRGLERAVLLPALILFVLILGCYFVVIPTVVSPMELEREALAFHLYMFFDGLLAMRFLYLSRIASSLRWRLVYMSYGLAALLQLASSTVEWRLWLRFPNPDWSTPLNALWSLPFVVFALAPAFGRVRYTPRTTKPRILEPWHGTLAGSSRVTMAWALLLPLTHIALHHFELLDPVSRSARRDMVLACVVLLGIAAMVQQRILVQRTRKLWEERRDVERSLRTSENDLRLMVERSRASEQLAAEDEKFTRAFRIHHDGLAISLLETGEIIDVNPAFEELSDVSRQDLLGRSGMDTGLWPSGRDRKQVIKMLEERGHLRLVEAEFQTSDGRKRKVLASFELLYDRRQRYMLTVLHDVSEERRAEHRLRRNAAYLDEADAALVAVDPDGRVGYWNPAAAKLFDISDGDRRSRWDQLSARRDGDVWTWNIELAPWPEDAGQDDKSRAGERLVVAAASDRLPPASGSAP